jgi:hypothetical protein
MVAAKGQIQVLVESFLVCFHIQSPRGTETCALIEAHVHENKLNIADRPGKINLWDQGVEKIEPGQEGLSAA